VKQLAFMAGCVILATGVLGAAYLVSAGQIPLTGYRFSGSTLRGPGAVGLAIGIAGGGGVAFFASCILMWPRSRPRFELLRNVSLVLAGAGMIIAVIGGYMARAGIGAI
jgi:hypothetical protein